MHLKGETVTVNNHGQTLLAYAHGREGVDQRIEQHTSASRIPNRYLYRPGASWIQHTEGSTTHVYNQTVPAYDSWGRLVHLVTTARLPASHPAGYEFGGDTGGADSFAQADQMLESSKSYDLAWGNPTASCVGADLRTESSRHCLRYGTVAYETDYAAYPVAESLAYEFGDDETLETSGRWDRGLGVLTSVTDPTGATTLLDYDGLGRLTAVTPPGDIGCIPSASPVQRFSYEFAPGGQPISVVTAYTEHNCVVGADRIETRTYVDGLGRPRASLSPASAADPAAWIQSGITILNQRGTVKRAYQPSG
ncbi:MAG: hypothetical protein SangKO_074010 [Sandaracinaceae bacterium]